MATFPFINTTVENIAALRRRMGVGSNRRLRRCSPFRLNLTYVRSVPISAELHSTQRRMPSIQTDATHPSKRIGQATGRTSTQHSHSTAGTVFLMTNCAIKKT